jgi:hypothetical protein
MRTAGLILVQPDGKIKRLVLTTGGDDTTEDESIIASLCDAMMDAGFRSKFDDVDEVSSRQIKAVFHA